MFCKYIVFSINAPCQFVHSSTIILNSTTHNHHKQVNTMYGTARSGCDVFIDIRTVQFYIN